MHKHHVYIKTKSKHRKEILLFHSEFWKIKLDLYVLFQIKQNIKIYPNSSTVFEFHIKIMNTHLTTFNENCLSFLIKIKNVFVCYSSSSSNSLYFFVNCRILSRTDFICSYLPVDSGKFSKSITSLTPDDHASPVGTDENGDTDINTGVPCRISFVPTTAVVGIFIGSDRGIGTDGTRSTKINASLAPLVLSSAVFVAGPFVD